MLKAVKPGVNLGIWSVTPFRILTTILLLLDKPSPTFIFTQSRNEILLQDI